ncbi:hypothetical protein Q4E93_06190 [Flavitalea sp. BT771]|uniref:hypothetical protein n=1 Tax=Flavitalea sp. BT771 TaxID=3063329 RepID=UPI0026E23090|nr:hypothetical protein [Flavitalea sp. BT771]MDO6430165.1 hypothetical protein [Flavitalea sp. BT771]MDV6219696.1 hypothetical protein [Flavitalea sp. BT771]
MLEKIMFVTYLLYGMGFEWVAALADVLLNNSDKSLSARPDFWLASGMLFYSSIFVLHYIPQLSSQHPEGIPRYFLVCSSVANTFMDGGFIACFKALRREDGQKNPVTSAP